MFYHWLHMGDTLKIFFSTIILVLITSIVFFALYFLFPAVSEQAFGISYRSSKEAPVETLNRILEETAPDRAADETPVGTVSVAVPAGSADASATPVADEAAFADGPSADPVAVAAEPDLEESIPPVTSSGEEVLAFFDTAKGRTLVGAAGMIGGLDLDMAAMADTMGGRNLVNTVGEYLEKTGQSMDDIFSNKAIMSALTGKVDEKVAGLLSYLEEEGAI